MPNVREFGAKGDGSTDDTPALQQALDVVAKGGILFFEPGTYRTTKPLLVEITQNVTRPFGIVAEGAQILSQSATPAPVLTITSRATARYLNIDGLSIKGSKGEVHGLALRAPGGKYLYNLGLHNCTVEGVGGDGYSIIGNIFEGGMYNCYGRDNANNGITLGHGDGGILSAMRIWGGTFGGNGRVGAEVVGNAYDVKFDGTYFLENNKFGLLAHNGIRALVACGFENNWREGGAGGAGARILNFGTLISCTATANKHPQSHLLSAFVVGKFTLIDCQKSGPTRLAQLAGNPAGGEVIMINCTGEVDPDPGFRSDVRMI
jgi:hypothetical protein